MKESIKQRTITAIFLMLITLYILLYSSIINVSAIKTYNDVNIEIFQESDAESRSVYTLTYWYSNKYEIGRWTNIPTLYYTYIGDNSTIENSFEDGIEYADDKWSYALDINIYPQYTPNEDMYTMHFYCGDEDELSSLEIFSDNDIYNSNTKGQTVVYGYQTDTFLQGGRTIVGYELTKVEVFIKENTAANIVKKVCTHELGHSLGWLGHSSNSSDMMYAYDNNVLQLTERDIVHLKQVYDLF